MEHTTEQVIQQTKQWISLVVIGCGFCPFAYKTWADNSIVYTVIEGTALHTHPGLLQAALERMDNDTSIETCLLIFTEAYTGFNTYLNFLRQAEKMMARKGYEGTYQLASFHPEYTFEGATEDDPANYTNRSPYPMLHILKEDSVSKAVASVGDADNIPRRNIRFATQKGLDYMKELLEKAKNVS